MKKNLVKVLYDLKEEELINIFGGERFEICIDKKTGKIIIETTTAAAAAITIEIN